MSVYTTQVRWIVEVNSLDAEDQPMSKRIEIACPRIFNFTYPIWSENHRVTLEKKILLRYFNKEIGLETVGLWKLYMEERLNDIMPYYVDLYETTTREFDYLWNNNFKEEYTGNKQILEDVLFNATGNSKATATGKDTFHGTSDDTFHGEGSTKDDGTSTSKTTELNSDLPQANYAGVDYGSGLRETDQSGTTSNNGSQTNDSTNANTQDNTTDRTQESNIDTTNDSTNKLTNNQEDTFTRTRTGSSNIPISDLIMKYRNTLLNIDSDIVKDCSDLFMRINGRP